MGSKLQQEAERCRWEPVELKPERVSNRKSKLPGLCCVFALTTPERHRLAWRRSAHTGVFGSPWASAAVCVHPVAMAPAGEFDTTSAAYSASLLMKSLEWKVVLRGLQVLLESFPKG